MIEILKFIFSSFWNWAGTVVLILAIGAAINAIIVGVRGKPVSLFKI